MEGQIKMTQVGRVMNHPRISASTSTEIASATLDDERAANAEMVGNKAARLADLRGRGFNVPRGIVLTAAFCESSPSESAIVSALRDFKPDGHLVAVRSSGIAEDGDDEAMAGRYRTELNVAWSDLPASVLRCIAAAARVDEREGRTHQPVAILIQQMVPADSAGA